MNEQEWRSRIDEAIASNTLLFHCQPVYRLYSRDAELYEVLCRLRGEDGEIIPAARFVHSVTDEQWRAIDRLAVLGTLEHLKKTHIPHAINLSASTLDDLQFPGWLAEQIKQSGVAPSRLLVELTEDTQFLSGNNAMLTVTAIRSLNLQVGMDDAGVGMANIPGLIALKPDFLKVDGSIVRLIAGESADRVRRSIVYMFMAYCDDQRNVPIILEHVENGEILTQIQKMAEYFPMLKVYVQGHFELFGEAKEC